LCRRWKWNSAKKLTMDEKKSRLHDRGLGGKICSIWFKGIATPVARWQMHRFQAD
jgi:hypothetical protein